MAFPLNHLQHVNKSLLAIRERNERPELEPSFDDHGNDIANAYRLPTVRPLILGFCHGGQNNTAQARGLYMMANEATCI
jgi:hypothetical protein